MTERIIGILGGMGPEATIDLFTKIVRGTKVKKDQDHLRILIDNNPKVPDRTRAIQGKGPSPVPEVARSARALERAGADFIVIPCVTVHHYYPALQKRVKIPVLHIIEETAKYVAAKFKGIKKIGLLATTGTIQAGLFQKGFSGTGKEWVFPSPDLQKKKVMEAIYGIKAVGPSDRSRKLVLQACKALIRQGAQAVIAGCTEIPLVLNEGDLPVPVIDPISVLARTAIQKAQGKGRP